MNPLYDLYRVIASAITEGIPEIKKVDIDLGQLKKDGETIPIEYPALLIKFENVFWRDYDGSKQIGVVHIRLKLIYPFIEDDQNYATESGVRTEAETFFNMLQSIFELLSAQPAGTNSKLLRFNENHIESLSKDLKWIYCMDYYCNIYSDGSEFGEEISIDMDYDLLLSDNSFLDRTLGGKKVG